MAAMNKSSFIKTMFVKYQSDLKRFVTLKFGDVDEAEDIVQDAFHNFLRTDTPETLENPRAYLYQTAHNLALNRIRKRKHHESYIAIDHNEEESRSPERITAGEKDLLSVQRSLTNLPPKCHKAFVMSRVDGKSYHDIADELGVSVSSVEKYMMRAMNFLRENFDETAE
ncbi:putative RNA polymerase sigma factor FecI [Thalassocella blandensis]|nr:putative RNA polymerase sigma factor FecI [Thalassocella blandensis]